MTTTHPVFGTKDVSRATFKPLASCESRDKSFYSTDAISDKNLIEGFLGSLSHLVLHGNLGGESVVRVPFLIEAQAQLLQLVLGLQTPACLARVNISRAGCVEFLEANTRANLRT